MVDLNEYSGNRKINFTTELTADNNQALEFSRKLINDQSMID